MAKIKEVNKYLIFILLLIFCVFEYGIEKICGFTIYPDEFGYWASAARAVGYDWAEVASLGSYYSFGYSLVLTPLLKLFPDGVSAYRAAIAVNFLFMCIGQALLMDVIKRCFSQITVSRKILIAGIAVLYPPLIFFSQMTLAESFLFLLFVLCTWLFIRLLSDPRIITVVMLAAVLVYMYAVHMRTIGIVIACMITLFLWGMSRSGGRRLLLVFSGIMIITGAAFLAVKGNVISQVFTHTDAAELAINGYGSQWGKFRRAFCGKGIPFLLIGLMGKAFYLEAASFGTFFFALVWAVRETFFLFIHIKRKETCQLHDLMGCFFFLSVMGELLISTIYMYDSQAVDCLIYGRYNDFLIPMLMVFGIGAMYQSRYLFRKVLLHCAISGMMIPFLIFYINNRHMEGIRGYFAAGISYLLDEECFIPSQFLWKAWLLGCIFAILMALAVWLGRRFRNTDWALIGMIVIEILLGNRLSAQYTYRVNEVLFSDLMITETIEKEDGQGEVVYLNENQSPYIDFQQMQLGDRSIKVITEEDIDDLLFEGRFLIVDRHSRFQEGLKKKYDRQIVTSTFALYYNKSLLEE